MVSFKIRQIFNYATCCIICLSINCTYDKSLIYKKDYTPGTNSLFHFDGFYSTRDNHIITQYGRENFLLPLFFYRDGSVIQMGNVKDTSQLSKMIYENPFGIWGYWGNYVISNDTIRIETIASKKQSFHHYRTTKYGVLKKDSITFFQLIDNKNNIKIINETIHFNSFHAKPDSSENWIRKKRKYNK
jgi:hypothetical protein